MTLFKLMLSLSLGLIFIVQAKDVRAVCVPEDAARKVALVIANSTYAPTTQMTPLPGANNDGVLIRDTLTARGFEVTLVTDLGERDFKKTVYAFGRSVRCHDHAIVYYSGHGFEISGKNYLVPVDADTSSKDMIAGTSINIDDIYSALATDSEQALRWVVLDACRNNPFKNDRSIGGRGFQTSPTGQNITVWFSTAPGKIAADRVDPKSETSGSPFALAFADVVKNDAACSDSLDALRRQITKTMRDSLGSSQRPFASSSNLHDFRFCKAQASLTDKPQGKVEKLTQTPKTSAPRVDAKELELSSSISFVAGICPGHIQLIEREGTQVPACSKCPDNAAYKEDPPLYIEQLTQVGADHVIASTYGCGWGSNNMQYGTAVLKRTAPGKWELLEYMPGATTSKCEWFGGESVLGVCVTESMGQGAYEAYQWAFYLENDEVHSDPLTVFEDGVGGCFFKGYYKIDSIDVIYDNVDGEGRPEIAFLAHLHYGKETGKKRPEDDFEGCDDIKNGVIKSEERKEVRYFRYVGGKYRQVEIPTSKIKNPKIRSFLK
jgi:hypothetical protein